MHKPCLLLTATIHCKDTPFIKRQDPEIRESDYRWAVEGWMGVEGYDTFLFCENSGADLSRLEKYAASINRFGHNLVFLSLKDNSRSSERGKGYGEMEIIRHAIERLKDRASDQMLVKVTGRYRARNAAHFFSQLPSMHGEIICSIGENLTFTDSRLFAISLGCARDHLLPRQEEINEFEHKYFEHALSDAVHETILAGGKWFPLPCDPSLYGFEGTDGTRFGFSPMARVRSKVKRFLARKIYSGIP
jgi:hypothetical protein